MTVVAGQQGPVLTRAIAVDPWSLARDTAGEMIVREPTVRPEGSSHAETISIGVVAPLRTDVPSWLEQARRIQDNGYSTLLMPDFPQLQPAPGPTLATAAAVTDLRVGTWVYAAPLRPAWLTAGRRTP